MKDMSLQARCRRFMIGVLSASVIGTVAYLLCCAESHAATMSPDLAVELANRGPQEELSVIVTLTDQVDRRMYKSLDRSQRNTRLVKALKTKAAVTQGLHRGFLNNNGARHLRELWVINGMAVTARASIIRKLASRPGIGHIRLDSTLQAPSTTFGVASPPEWNLNLVHAPELWSLGYDGSGVVVANMDSGVDGLHPDLATRWRGGDNSWFDPHGQHATPHDSDGHGTQTMAIMVGGDAGGSAIGMAPGAQWIAVKMYNDAGLARYSDIHLSFQWLLDPDGDANTLDAPDVVNASWGLVGTAGQCNTEFNADIDALKTAGIAVAFAAGNDGPAPLSSLSPANNPQGFSAGAVDASLVVASFSSRGQSACDGGIFPKLVTPGVNINTADLSFGGLPFYAVVSGTSFAAPHVAGAMALLAQAFPGANVDQIEAALIQSAGDLGVAGADNSYGYGFANVHAAYQLLLAGAGGGSPPTITSTPPISATEGSPYDYTVVASDPDGDALVFSLDEGPVGMTIDVSTGVIAWTPASNQVGANTVSVRVTDTSGQSAMQTYSVLVANLNEAPVATNNTYSLNAGTTLGAAAPGVLDNDTDADGDTLSAALVSGAAHGNLSFNGNGSFSFTPNAGYTGSDSFVYRAYDGALYSNNATVSLTVNAVNKAPIAKNDSATAAKRTGTSYTSVAINVLGNDRDPDGSLDPSSVTITVAPNKGGTVTVNGSGQVLFTPKLKFSGTEVFWYTVRDMKGAVSNMAKVTVRVR